MTTMTSTSTSAASLAPLQMHLPTNPPAEQTQGALSVGYDSLPMTSPNALGFALLAAEERLQEGNDQMLDVVLELVFNLGQIVKDLKGEKARLQGEIPLQHRRIEILETVHQEKWTAHLEATRVRMHAISSEISKIIQSMETFQAKYPMVYHPDDLHSLERLLESGDNRKKLLGSLGPKAYHRTMGAYVVQANHLHVFRNWLGVTDKSIDKSLELHPIAKVPPQTAALAVVAVANPMALKLTNSCPQIARFVQNRLSLEREISGIKQELVALEQIQQAKEKEHRSSVRAFNHVFRLQIFEPSLQYAQLLHGMIDSCIQKAHEGCEDVEEGFGRREEANRLKRMISATLPHIQEALAWTKQEMGQ